VTGGTDELVEAYDEAFAAPGVPREEYAELLEWLASSDLTQVRDRVHASLAGVSFSGPGGDEAFLVDPVPRVLTAGEWRRAAAGLEQRMRALDAFVRDAYGARRCVAEGVIPARVLDEADGFAPALRGAAPDWAHPVGVAGLDLVRTLDGDLQVLEDNIRSPSGMAYALAARDAVRAALPDLARAVPVEEPLWALLGATLRGAAPPGVDEPFVVVLTDGVDNSAFYEHRRLAEGVGAPLLTPADLDLRGDRVVLRNGGRRVDVVYRRCDDDAVDGTPAALLLPAWRAGTVGLVNGFGNGVADDKLAHAYVEDLVRFYCGEEPLLRSVPSADLTRPAAREEVLGDLRSWVVKPRGGYGGEGVVIGAHAADADLRALAARVREHPERYIAQRTVPLSRHPTVVGDGVLEPRHVDLRPFVFRTPDGPRALPGGLTRVAWDRGALVVNSSQNGGAKDTWVLT
jgi:uncharacterized circularly permuted ATP-grasp superfamily protein